MTALKKSTPPIEKRARTSKQKTDAFEHTMAQARSHMPGITRIFSKFIHLRLVEFVSDIIGNTLLRPTAIIMGSLCALFFSGTLYLIAKRYGYELAGSEFFVAFGFGWFAGSILDYIGLLFRSITKKRH